MPLRILHTVEFYAPSLGGAQEVVRQISEHLADRGHSVTVATTRHPDRAAPTHNGVRIAEFSVMGNAVRGLTGEVDAYRDFILNGDFEVVMNYAAQQWATDALLPVLEKVRCPRILAPCGFSGLFDPRYSAYFRDLPARLEHYDRFVVHSETYRDARFLVDHGISRRRLIPNGADEREFGEPDPPDSFRARHGIAPDVPLLLSVGSHTGLKGHSLTMEAFRRARIDRAVLVIIGNTVLGRGCLWDCRRRAAVTAMSSLGKKKVRLLDPHRQETIAAYRAADLFVFGSSIECSPLVLFEAMAAGTPFVSVAAGNAAEIAEWSGGGLVVPTTQRGDGTVTADPDDLAGAIERLVHDRGEARRLGDAGLMAWQREFTWESISRQYEDLYEEVVR